MSSDIGLAGGFNSNIVKEFLREKKPGDEVIAIGKKLHSSLGARNIEHTHYSLAQAKEVGTQDEISMRLMKAYFEDTEIKSVYTKYESQIDFKATIKILLPVTISEDDNLETITNIDFEPSANNILLSMLPLYLSASLNGLIKESEVSEHSARRVAMENATTNGEEIMNDLNVQYNKQRQAKITQEISEIVGGTEALK
ncbi:MAG: hypothetical protein DRP42_01390 [Tenericutes bacterium]|nr:MAG: hypothetical protein DRP42_01390 [Mycoplasmatota bacterium]